MSTERKFTTAARFIFGGFLSVILLSACTNFAARATPIIATDNAPRITIHSVRVIPREGIYITASSTLPAGDCVKTELLVDENAAAWWPRDLCIEMDDTGEWELLVALGRSGVPQELESGQQYEIRAWWPDNQEESMTRFYFDLDGPQSPP